MNIHNQSLWNWRKLTAIAGCMSGLLWTTPAQAELKEVDVRLRVRDGESFAVLVRKAEVLARTAVQQAFDRDVLVSDVSVKVTAQKQERIAPVFRLRVTRTEWQQRPDPKVWATYVPIAQQLIGID